MDMKEIARELAAGCRAGSAEVKANLDRLYAEDAVSVEAADMSGQGRETHGLEAIKGKHEWWESAMEEHASSVMGPFWHGEDRFALFFEVEATDKASGERSRMREIGHYQVADGRIVREEFFYALD